MSVHVSTGETFADLWDGDDAPIDERKRCQYHPIYEPCPNRATVRAVHPSPSVGVLDVCAIHAANSMLLSGGFIDSARRADGELVGQLRLPDELLPVARGEMFP